MQKIRVRVAFNSNSQSYIQRADGDYTKLKRDGWSDALVKVYDLDEWELDFAKDRYKTVSQIAKNNNYDDAYNFTFAYNGNSIGYAVKDGKLVNDTVAAADWCNFVLDENDKIKIGRLINRSDTSGIKLGLSSTSQIVKNSQIFVNTWIEGTPDDVKTGRHPRIAFGVTNDNKLIVVIVEGRNNQSAGMRLDELARLMIDQGSVDAVNGDGGGSITGYNNGKIMNVLPDGKERGVGLAFGLRRKFNKTPLYKVEITAGALNIRNQPTTSGSVVLGIYKQKEQVEVFQESGIWLRTNRGWISSNFTKKLQDVWKGWRITSEYGDRISPISGRQETHTGVDLADYHKKPIKSFTAGTVIRAEFGRAGTGFGGFGNIVAIKDDKFGYQVMYAHLDSINVKQGDAVNVGDIVGTQGATGNVTGSHLHFEVRPTGFPSHTDPIEFVEKYENYQPKPAKPETPQEPAQPEHDVDIQTQLGLEALQYLADNGIIDTPTSWQDKMREPSENWLTFVLVKRIHEQLK